MYKNSKELAEFVWDTPPKVRVPLFPSIIIIGIGIRIIISPYGPIPIEIKLGVTTSKAHISDPIINQYFLLVKSATQI